MHAGVDLGGWGAALSAADALIPNLWALPRTVLADSGHNSSAPGPAAAGAKVVGADINTAEGEGITAEIKKAIDRKSCWHC